jgi:hypothetical protein
MAEQVSDRAETASIDLAELVEVLRLDPYYGDPARVDALLDIARKRFYTIEIAPSKRLHSPVLARQIGPLPALVKIWLTYHSLKYAQGSERVSLDVFQECLRGLEQPLPYRLFPTAPDTTLHYLELEVSRRIHQWPIVRPATNGEISPWLDKVFPSWVTSKDAKISQAFERDYEQWLQKPFWLQHVAVRVLLGGWFAPATMLLPDTPMESPEPNRLSRAGHPWLPGHNKIYEQAISAIKLGQLALFDPAETVGKTIQQLQDIGFNLTVAPRVFLSWALASKLPMPPTLAAHASAYATTQDAVVEDSIDRADAKLGGEVREQRRRFGQKGCEDRKSQKELEWAPWNEVMRQVLETRPELSNTEIARQVIELTRKSPTPCKKSVETLRKEVPKLRASRTSKPDSTP